MHMVGWQALMQAAQRLAVCMQRIAENSAHSQGSRPNKYSNNNGLNIAIGTICFYDELAPQISRSTCIVFVTTKVRGASVNLPQCLAYALSALLTTT